MKILIFAILLLTPGVAWAGSVYAQRDNSGNVVGVSQSPQPGDSRFDVQPVDESDPAVQAFVHPQLTAQQIAAQQYAQLKATGAVQINFTSAPQLDAVYGVSAADQGIMGNIVAGIAAGRGVPGNGSTFVYLDASKQPHLFTAQQLTDMAQAVRDYLYAMALAAAGQGGAPSTPLTIP